MPASENYVFPCTLSFFVEVEGGSLVVGCENCSGETSTSRQFAWRVRKQWRDLMFKRRTCTMTLSDRSLLMHKYPLVDEATNAVNGSKQGQVLDVIVRPPSFLCRQEDCFLWESNASWVNAGASWHFRCPNCGAAYRLHQVSIR